MSIRKVVWRLGMCAGITLSANTYAIVLSQSEPVASSAPQFEYHVPRLRTEVEGTGDTGGYSSGLSWNRSPDFLLLPAAGYFDMLPLPEDFASPSTGSDFPPLGGNEAFGVNIPGFINDEAGLVNLLAVPDMFMQAQWQPTEGNLQTTPFIPHSYSGNAARIKNRVQVCTQLREVRRSRLEPRDGDCIGFGGGSDGGGNVNGNGSRAGGSPNAIAARNRNVRNGSTLDGAYAGGGGGGTGEGPRDAATPGTEESSKGGGMSPPGSNNSDLDNSSEGNPGGAEGGGSNQSNGNGGAGDGNGGSGGIGGNEDWGSGNGDTGNWNDPGEEGAPPSEIMILPEPATSALLGLGLAALCAVRRNQGKIAG